MGDHADDLINQMLGFHEDGNWYWDDEEHPSFGRRRKKRKFQSNKPDIWKDQHDKKWVIDDMETSHIINCIRFMERNDLAPVQLETMKKVLELRANEGKPPLPSDPDYRPQKVAKKVSAKGRLFGEQPKEEEKGEYSKAYPSHDADGNEIDF